MTDGSVINRIGKKFNEEIENIKYERIHKGIDKKKKSTRMLTDLIIRHRDWKKIREDTINIKLEK